jgi:phosphoglycerate dehydrogenase-like enzyme
MSALLVSHVCHAMFGADLAAALARLDLKLDVLVLPEDSNARLAEADIARVEIAFFSQDIVPDFSRQFFSAVRKAPNVKWLHVFNVGVDHPIFTEMLARGVRLTTSTGTTAEPIAQTALTGLLMLARGFPHWLKAQREHRWDPVRLQVSPRDLKGQTVLVYGLGEIGREFARLAKALGLYVIGVRRSPRRADDPVDELRTPDQLDQLLPRADWLMLACPLTAETRGLITAQRLALLPRGAHIINIARGEVIDEPALIAALQSGHLAGAYLDVFAEEPLPATSPLWDMPNVLVTPHNSSTALGNERRVFDMFVNNLERWKRGAPLINEVFNEGGKSAL